jgi:hypothetical protein
MPPLALEEYAAIAARLLRDAGRPSAEVLAELCIPVRVWQASAAAWEAALDDELARGEDHLFSAFAARFLATRAALGRVARPAPAVMPDPYSPRPPDRREPALVPDVPDIPILPDTLALDRRDAARPALPFAGRHEPRSPEEEAARRAAAASVLPFRPRPPEAPAPPPAPEPTPIPLVRVKRPPRGERRLTRLWAWLCRRRPPESA